MTENLLNVTLNPDTYNTKFFDKNKLYIKHMQMTKQEGQVALKRSPEFCLKLTYRYL